MAAYGVDDKVYSVKPNLAVYTFFTLYLHLQTTIPSRFFVGLKNETKDLPAFADWFFNIDHCVAGVCTVQYEVSYE